MQEGAFARVVPEAYRIPTSTYRVQLSSSFGFRRLIAQLDYLRDLGVGDVYLSPIFTSRAESQHGYDVLNPNLIDQSLGGEEAFLDLCAALRERGMGMLLDFVPNHMGIVGTGNFWWKDLLEHGRTSRFADYFDVFWDAPAAGHPDKIVLPLLPEPYEALLYRGEIRVEHRAGNLDVVVGPLRLPLASTSWEQILGPVRTLLLRRPNAAKALWEMESLLHAIAQMPMPPDIGVMSDAVKETRFLRKRAIRQQLGELVAWVPEVAAELERVLATLNGIPGERSSFERLDHLLELQHFHLAYWKVAKDAINYRRFFDVNELAAIRIEIPEVFEAVHGKLFELIGKKLVQGVRIDHLDGLRDPEEYLERLAAGCANACGIAAARVSQAAQTPVIAAPEATTGAVVRQVAPETGAFTSGPETRQPAIYTVVEKILDSGEVMPGWPVNGTTGYEFSQWLDRLFLDPVGLEKIDLFYSKAIAPTGRSSLHDAKREILVGSLSSEVNQLAQRVFRHAEVRPGLAELEVSLPEIRLGLVELVAAFPQYRSYVRGGSAGKLAPPASLPEANSEPIRVALSRARSMEIAQGGSLDLLEELLLSPGVPELVDRFQQLTAPAMAKGLEDTLLYRDVPLVSRNDVGGHPESTALSPESFHALQRERSIRWPHALSTSMTHDSKRSEDVRARLIALTRFGDRWIEVVTKWMDRYLGDGGLEDRSENANEFEISRREAYLAFQTLIASWPDPKMLASVDYPRRVADYQRKAAREAKLETSWEDPNLTHESCLSEFVDGLFRTGSEFPQELEALLESVGEVAYGLSLVRTTLKLTSPGVPDCYQGAELWTDSLVDPDNRGPVDFTGARSVLQEMRDLDGRVPEVVARTLREMGEGREPSLKLWITRRLLSNRRQEAAFWNQATYHPCSIHGSDPDRVVAYLRSWEQEHRLVVCVRDFDPVSGFLGSTEAGRWCADYVELPPGLSGTTSWRDVITGRSVELSLGRLSLASAFSVLPLIVLERTQG